MFYRWVESSLRCWPYLDNCCQEEIAQPRTRLCRLECSFDEGSGILADDEDLNRGVVPDYSDYSGDGGKNWKLTLNRELLYSLDSEGSGFPQNGIAPHFSQYDDVDANSLPCCSSLSDFSWSAWSSNCPDCECICETSKGFSTIEFQYIQGERTQIRSCTDKSGDTVDNSFCQAAETTSLSFRPIYDVTCENECDMRGQNPVFDGFFDYDSSESDWDLLDLVDLSSDMDYQGDQPFGLWN